MKIDRTPMLEALESFALGGNGVVVGDPGIGKTYSLVNLRRRLLSKGIPHLFLAIDQLGSGTEEELRSELSFEGDFIEKLQQELEQSGGRPGVLLFDAFDAARSEVKQKNFLRIVRRAVTELRDSWNIVVSVRTYDAKRSPELLDLFAANSHVPASVYQQKGIRCRHFKVPLLDEDEVAQALAQIPYGEVAYEQGSQGFRELLRVPFNLWLLEMLLSWSEGPATAAEVSEAWSQVQLLQLFWDRRVRGAPDGDQREAILTKATRAMVVERALSTRKEEIVPHVSRETWRGLLSDGLLQEVSSSRQRVSYSHNLLFDFAVSILLIEDEPEHLVSFLLEDPSRPLFLRPSLSFYFTRLWYDDPDTFWLTFSQILFSTDTHLRLFARLLPSAVVASEARTLRHLAPLLRLLSEEPVVGNTAVLRILQAVRALEIHNDRLWVKFAKEIAPFLHRDFAWEAATATSQMLRRAQEADDSEVLQGCGEVGRDLLQWALRERQQKIGDAFADRLGAAHAVPIVAQTFGTAVEPSRELLGRVLDLINEEGFPIDYLLRLTDEVDNIWPHDPGFVVSIYEAVFGHIETSQERTHMGGIVLPLMSNRRQDFDLCRYTLVEQFSGFLAAHPIAATRAAVLSLNRFIISEHLVGYVRPDVKVEDIPEHFMFRGKQANYVADGSYIWDEGPYADEPTKMADSLFEFIGQLTSSQDTLPLIDSILDILRDEVWMAFFWRRLLRVAAEAPEVFAPRLFELCLARPVQTRPETVWDLGNFLRVATRFFEEDQRAALEADLIDLPKLAEDEEDSEYLEHYRNRLLASIPADLLSTERGQQLRQVVELDPEVRENRPPVTFDIQTEPYSEERHLRRRGADTVRPENRALLDLLSPLDAFTSRWANEEPGEEAVREILPLTEEVYRRVREPGGADRAVVESAWSKLAASVAIMSRTAWREGGRAFEFCREVLLVCADHPAPEPAPERDERFDFPVWSPEPRNEAAQGLPLLARRRSDEQISGAVDQLLADRVPSVRYLSARNLFWLIENHRTDFWRLVYRTAEDETNGVVLQGLCETLWYTVSEYESESAQALSRLFERVFTEDQIPILDAMVDLTVWLLIRRENDWAAEAMDAVLSDPVHFRKPLRRAVLYLARFVDLRRADPQPKAYVMDRAIFWQGKIIAAAATGVRELRRSSTQSGASADEETQKLIVDTYAVIDEVVTRLYFAADLRDGPRDDRNKAISREDRKHLYFKSKPLLEQVLSFAQSDGNGMLLARTAHYFMQLLNGVLEYDPRGVLHMASNVALSSKPYGYNLDSLAVREAVNLVGAALADHRPELRQGEVLGALLTLLDVFAEAGWPDALNLVWRLDEVFR